MQERQEKFRPDLAETFEAEFMNTAMIPAANFGQNFNLRIDRAHDDNKGSITHYGSRPDGTTIEIKFTKGANYKSPAQIEQEHQERQKEKK